MSLWARIPPKDTARIRFTLGRKSMISEFIVLHFGVQFAHAEAVLFDGTIVTSLIGLGVHRYPNDSWYNAGTTNQQFVDLPMPHEQYEKWVTYLCGLVGSKYDDSAALGMLFGLSHVHADKEYICSMVVMSSLVNCGWCTLSDPTLIVSPTVLLEMLKADPRCIVHPPEVEKEFS